MEPGKIDLDLKFNLCKIIATGGDNDRVDDGGCDDNDATKRWPLHTTKLDLT